MEAVNELKTASENNDENIRRMVQSLVRTYHPVDGGVCQTAM